MGSSFLLPMNIALLKNWQGFLGLKHKMCQKMNTSSNFPTEIKCEDILISLSVVNYLTNAD